MIDFPVDALKQYDHVTQAWNKRGHANKVLQLLIEHDVCSSRGGKVDKDGLAYRLYFPALGAMWSPVAETQDAWNDEAQRIKDKYNG